jgi:hypothetical protein
MEEAPFVNKTFELAPVTTITLVLSCYTDAGQSYHHLPHTISSEVAKTIPSTNACATNYNLYVYVSKKYVSGHFSFSYM